MQSSGLFIYAKVLATKLEITFPFFTESTHFVLIFEKGLKRGGPLQDAS